MPDQRKRVTARPRVAKPRRPALADAASQLDADLEGILGNAKAAVRSELKEIIAGYRGARKDQEAAARWRYRRAGPSESKDALGRIRRAALAVRQALDLAPQMVRERVLVTMRARVAESTFGVWRPGDLFEMEIHEVAVAAGELLAEPAGRGRRGPRPDPLKLAFNIAVARALERHGVRPTGHVTGKYARVLRAAWTEATDTRLPEDIRPTLRAALKAHRTTQDTARRG